MGAPRLPPNPRRGANQGTVKKHLDNVNGKLGVHGRVAVTAFVFDMLDR